MSPNKKETKLKLKNPISPQFTAPTIAIVRANKFNNFIDDLQKKFNNNAMISSIVCVKNKKLYTESYISVIIKKCLFFLKINFQAILNG